MNQVLKPTEISGQEMFQEDDGFLTEEHIAAVKAELRESDGEPLDSPWHRAAINLLIESVLWHRRRQKKDFFVGGNMFIYYSRTQARKWTYKGPDFFFVKGVDGTRERRFWWVFEEGGKYPDVIMELLSPTTAREDRTKKKDLYQKVFRTPEYFWFDPDKKELVGWRLENGEYRRITPNDKGWLWSEELELWVGTWDGTYQGIKGTWVRFYDSRGNLVLTETEYEKLRADAEKQKADTEKQRADSEKERADSEKQRADKLEAQLARLMAKKKGKPGKPKR